LALDAGADTDGVSLLYIDAFRCAYPFFAILKAFWAFQRPDPSIIGGGGGLTH